MKNTQHYGDVYIHKNRCWMQWDYSRNHIISIALRLWDSHKMTSESLPVSSQMFKFKKKRQIWNQRHLKRIIISLFRCSDILFVCWHFSCSDVNRCSCMFLSVVVCAFLYICEMKKTRGPIVVSIFMVTFNVHKQVMWIKKM